MPVLEDVKIKPFGRKAHAFATRPPLYDAPINILHGAVRSSKTYACIPKILSLSDYPVQGVKLITGVSKGTIYTNILNDLFEVLGRDNYTYNRSSGELDIMGCKWHVMGAKDEGSEKYVRGMTVGVHVGDELTLQPRSFTMMVLNRMSPDNARYYGTTNPDNPLHYVKTDIIENPEYLKRGYVWSEHFTLDDNPNISEDRKAYLKSLYKGVYHLRYILGQWVIAEGAIYKDSWSEDLVYNRKLGITRQIAVEEYVGIDCGVAHPQVYLYVIDDGTTLWFDKQYHWDSEKKMQQKSDRQYADDLEKFLGARTKAQCILPPECASFEAELNSRGIWYCIADNEVNDGIRMVSSLMAQKKIRIRVEDSCRGQAECNCGTQCCAPLLREIPVYSWDPKKAMRGLEEPVKVQDDGCDAKRYIVKTKIPAWRMGIAS